MFPINLRAPYLLYSVLYAVVLLTVVFASLVLNQPLGIALALFGLNSFAPPPVIEPGAQEPGDYDGSGKPTGFLTHN